MAVTRAVSGPLCSHPLDFSSRSPLHPDEFDEYPSTCSNPFSRENSVPQGTEPSLWSKKNLGRSVEISPFHHEMDRPLCLDRNSLTVLLSSFRCNTRRRKSCSSAKRRLTESPLISQASARTTSSCSLAAAAAAVEPYQLPSSVSLAGKRGEEEWGARRPRAWGASCEAGSSYLPRLNRSR